MVFIYFVVQFLDSFILFLIIIQQNIIKFSFYYHHDVNTIIAGGEFRILCRSMATLGGKDFAPYINIMWSILSVPPPINVTVKI
jgi:hypothetical protein